MSISARRWHNPRWSWAVSVACVQCLLWAGLHAVAHMIMVRGSMWVHLQLRKYKSRLMNMIVGSGCADTGCFELQRHRWCYTTVVIALLLLTLLHTVLKLVVFIVVDLAFARWSWFRRRLLVVRLAPGELNGLALARGPARREKKKKKKGRWSTSMWKHRAHCHCCRRRWERAHCCWRCCCRWTSRLHHPLLHPRRPGGEQVVLANLNTPLPTNSNPFAARGLTGGGGFGGGRVVGGAARTGGGASGG